MFDLVGIFGHTLTVWLIIPTLIFFARIIDVSIGTIRVIFVAKGMKFLAPVLGFFEVLVWLLAIGEILKNLTSWQNYIAYACGFAMGNFVGMLIESKIALGNVIIRIITRYEANSLVEALREKNFGVTSIDADGRDGPVKILFTLTTRTSIPKILNIVNEYNPNAFYSIEDIRYVSEGIFPVRKTHLRARDLIVRKLFHLRK
ncbi:DUF2179 domain-containing protein [bacterium]|nr:DUF2179 domain-containing protein [bacterium]